MAAGRPKGKYSQAYRLVKIMEMLQTRRVVTVKMIMDEFQTSRRTTHRDLATMQESYSVEEAGWLTDGQKTWQLTGPRRGEMIKLSVMEMAALFMGKNLFNFTQGTELKKSIDSLFEKVSHRLASSRSSYRERLESKFYCTPGAPKSYADVDEQLNMIVTGLLEEQRVRIVYQRPGAQPKEETIEPWTLVIHNHALYLIAHSNETNGIKTFAVERIREAEWLRGNKFLYPEDYDPERYLSQAFGITVGQPVHVRIRISPEIEEYFERRRWHVTQTMTQNDDGTTDVHMEVPTSPELLSWLMSFGGKIEVMEPHSIRRQLQSIAEGLVRLYAPDSLKIKSGAAGS
jgi:proteasome accessory factor B